MLHVAFAPRYLPLRLVLAALVAAVIGVRTASAAAPSVPAGYTLREWHEQDGLPSEELMGVQPDPAGFLWIAARSTLARFDGVTFEWVDSPAGAFTGGLAFRPPPSSATGWSAVLPGIRNGTTEAGYYRLARSGFEFEAVPELDGRDPRVISFTVDGAEWLGCEDGWVLRRHKGGTRLFEPSADSGGRKRPAFATDAIGRVWILRGDQLSCVEGDDWAPVPLPLPNSEARIASSASGGVWLFTRDRLWRWQDERFVERAVLPELQGAHFVQAAIEDRHGFLWVGTRSQGVYRVVNSELLPVPVSSNDVTALSEDADGNIWAATDGGGLSRLRPKAHHLFDRTSGLKDDLSYTVTTDTAGAVWLANRDGGMVRIVGETVEIASQRAGWRSFSARSAYAALDGTVWMTTGIGVFRTQAAAPDQLERVASLSHLRGARATYVTRAGDYWLAADPDRVARWTGGRLTTFGPDEGYGARELRALAEDSGGRLWLGAANGALFRFENERFQRVPFLYDHDAGVLQVIRCEDDGTLLIGTTRRGVLVVPRGDFARARYLDRQRGLVDNNISQILVDDADRVWFAARRGIFWIDGAQVRDFVAGRLDDVHAVVLGKDDGLPYLSCQGIYQPAAWKAQDGTLWFATRRGMLRTNPALLDSATAGPPPVAITAIACDGRIQPIATELALNSTVRQLELRLSVLNLTSPESVQIRTRLEGFDPDWVVHGNERVVRYPQLPPGRYAFTAIASNGSGAWSRPAALLTLVVSPPWWHRWWAWTGYVLVAVVVVVASVRRWSHRRLRRRLEQAEREHAIELERSRIARNIHDDVGASLTRISLLTQAAQQESGAASPTLEKIYQVARSITRSMDEIVWAVNPRHDNSESFAYYLSNYARAFLEAAGVRCRIESPPTLPDAVLTSQTRHHLFLSCKETLHNVVKHANATVVTIRLSVEANRLVVVIADDGRGLGAEARASDGPDSHASSGNGLRNMRQRMNEIDGTCSVVSGPEGGTVVAFSVPLLPPFPAEPLDPPTASPTPTR